MTDEELARLLQAELNGGVVDLTVMNDRGAAPSSNTVASDAVSTSAVVHADSLAATGGGSIEQYGHTFTLYHYNGLGGGTFRPLRVTRLDADEAIGASIPLGATHQHTMAGMVGDLEDVIRTKW